MESNKPTCQNHATDVAGITDMHKLASMVSDLRYDQLEKFMLSLGLKIARDGSKDYEEGRTQLGDALVTAGLKLRDAHWDIKKAWNISKKHMATDVSPLNNMVKVVEMVLAAYEARTEFLKRMSKPVPRYASGTAVRFGEVNAFGDRFMPGSIKSKLPSIVIVDDVDREPETATHMADAFEAVISQVLSHNFTPTYALYVDEENELHIFTNGHWEKID